MTVEKELLWRNSKNNNKEIANAKEVTPVDCYAKLLAAAWPFKVTIRVAQC